MKTCKIYGCKRPLNRQSAHGLCHAHVTRMRRGDLSADVPINDYVRKEDRKPARQLTELERRIRGAITTLTWSQVQ